MIIISIENADTAGKAITVIGGCADAPTRHDLRPGESARIAMMRTTQLSLSELSALPAANNDAQ